MLYAYIIITFTSSKTNYKIQYQLHILLTKGGPKTFNKSKFTGITIALTAYPPESQGKGGSQTGPGRSINAKDLCNFQLEVEDVCWKHRRSFGFKGKLRRSPNDGNKLG